MLILIAQGKPLGKIGGVGLGPFSGSMSAIDAMDKFAFGFSAIVGFLTVVGGIWFIFQCEINYLLKSL